MLNLNNISKHFDGIVAVDNLSLTVEQNEIVCLTGENGAGKTTLFNLITGFEQVDKGSISFKGQEITHSVPSWRAKQGIVRLFQSPRIFQHLTVKENILAAADCHPGEKIENYFTLKFKKILTAEKQNTYRAIELLSFCNLNLYQNDFASNLSFGQKKLLSLAMLLMNNASFFLLDEIFSGVNEQMIAKLTKLLTDLSKQGKTFIIIEHRVNLIKRICDRIIVMEQGKLKTNL